MEESKSGYFLCKATVQTRSLNKITAEKERAIKHPNDYDTLGPRKAHHFVRLDLLFFHVRIIYRIKKK